MKTIINTPNAPAPIGPYNQAVLVNNTLYTSGQIALDPNTMELVMDVMRSLDITLITLSGKDCASSSAILSTPGPINLMESLARHLGQLYDISSILPH